VKWGYEVALERVYNSSGVVEGKAQ
jgi:hypothetical protein